jgi:hypothetical protein
LEALAMEDVCIFTAILSILCPKGIHYGHLVHFLTFGIFFPVLVCCTEKNLATLILTVATVHKGSSVGRGRILNNFHCHVSQQGCQIFHETINQKEKKNVPNDHKLFQSAIISAKWL